MGHVLRNLETDARVYASLEGEITVGAGVGKGVLYLVIRHELRRQATITFPGNTDYVIADVAKNEISYLLDLDVVFHAEISPFKNAY